MTVSASDPRSLREDRAVYRAAQILERRARLTATPFDHATATDLFRARLHGLEREQFHVAFLDRRNHLICVECLFVGTVSRCVVEPREVARMALMRNASSVVLAHNHPSGDPAPSDADYAITHRIEAALRLFDIEVIEHIIVGRTGVHGFGPWHTQRQQLARERQACPTQAKRIEAASRAARTRKRNMQLQQEATA